MLDNEAIREIIKDNKMKERFLKFFPTERDRSLCWFWKDRVTRHMPGEFRYQNKFYPVEKIAYQLFVGDMERYAQIVHLCQSPGCINPWHLRLNFDRQRVTEGMIMEL